MRRLRYFLRGRLFPCALIAGMVVAFTVYLAIKLPRLLAPAALAERAFSFAAAAVTVASREIPERKIAKLALIAFLPWVGPALALFFADRASPPISHPPLPLGEGLFARAASLNLSLTGIAPGRAAGMTYCSVGEEMEKLLLRDLRRAKEHIYLEYYILARGAFLGEILAVLEERAKAGADVRVIFDDFGCGFSLPRRFAAELEARGIRAAVFRRVRFGRGFFERDHRKIAVIDGVAYTGGINLADEYIGKRIRFGHWKDTAVRMEGAGDAFCELFLRTWYALRPSERPKTAPPSPRGEARGIPYLALSDTTAGTRLGAQLFPLLFDGAERSVHLFTPYLSLPAPLLSALTCAARRGVDVRVMIPHIPDKKSVFFLTRAYARELGRLGVRVREYAAGFLHAKSAVIDGKIGFVGSYNLDFRSLFVQAECGALFEDGETASALERDFSSCWEQGLEVKKTNVFVRFLGRVCMIFAPLT